MMVRIMGSARLLRIRRSIISALNGIVVRVRVRRRMRRLCVIVVHVFQHRFHTIDSVALEIVGEQVRRPALEELWRSHTRERLLPRLSVYRIREGSVGIDE